MKWTDKAGALLIREKLLKWRLLLGETNTKLNITCGELFLMKKKSADVTCRRIFRKSLNIYSILAESVNAINKAKAN